MARQKKRRFTGDATISRRSAASNTPPCAESHALGHTSPNYPLKPPSRRYPSPSLTQDAPTGLIDHPANPNPGEPSPEADRRSTPSFSRPPRKKSCTSGFRRRNATTPSDYLSPRVVHVRTMSHPRTECAFGSLPEDEFLNYIDPLTSRNPSLTRSTTRGISRPITSPLPQRLKWTTCPRSIPAGLR